LGPFSAHNPAPRFSTTFDPPLLFCANLFARLSWPTSCRRTGIFPSHLHFSSGIPPFYFGNDTQRLLLNCTKTKGQWYVPWLPAHTSSPLFHAISSSVHRCTPQLPALTATLLLLSNLKLTNLAAFKSAILKAFSTSVTTVVVTLRLVDLIPSNGWRSRRDSCRYSASSNFSRP